MRGLPIDILLVPSVLLQLVGEVVADGSQVLNLTPNPPLPSVQLNAHLRHRVVIQWWWRTVLRTLPSKDGDDGEWDGVRSDGSLQRVVRNGDTGISASDGPVTSAAQVNILQRTI